MFWQHQDINLNLASLYFELVIKMPKKCCVTGCRANYDFEKGTVQVFRLPSNPDDRQSWINAIPTDIPYL